MKVKKLFLNKWIIASFVLLLILLIGFSILHFDLIPKQSYTDEDFGITAVKSTVDFNNNGVDDYTDILNGAKLEVENKPKYDGSYWEGGYPPAGVGACTDVVWRAFKNAGYCLRGMVNADIQNNSSFYPHIKKPDKNIDFRRTKNLKIFFERYATVLTNDPYEIASWQPGDIVIYNDNHIAIVSDKRNKEGLAYIIHHYSLLQHSLEEDALASPTITGHYRFDASLINKDFLIAWNE